MKHIFAAAGWSAISVRSASTAWRTRASPVGASSARSITAIVGSTSASTASRMQASLSLKCS